MVESNSQWQSLKFRDVAKFINGFAFKPSDWKKKGLPIIRIQNLNNLEKDFNYFDGKCDERYLIRDGDILISWSASLGVYIWKRGNAVLNQHIFKVILNEKIMDREFFYFCAQTKLEEMSAKVHGSTMKHITKQLFLDLEIPVPPIETQRRIASLLKSADQLRQKREQANQRADKILQAIFLEIFGDPATNPKQFKETILESVCSKIIDCPHTTPIYSDLGIPLIRTPNIKKGYIDFDNTKFVSWEEHCKRLTRIYPLEGDILYAREAPFGNAALVKSNQEFSVGQRIMLLRPNPVLVKSEFLVSLINSNFVYAQAKRLARGSTNPHVNVGDVKKFRIILPPISLQSKFASFIKNIDNLKKQQKKTTFEIQNLFKSLMSKAFKGELLVSIPDN